MSQTNYRPGSMGAAEKKSTKKFLIGAGVVYLIILLLLWGVIPTYMHQYFKRADFLLNLIGIIAILGSFYMIYSATKKGEAKVSYIIGAFILLAFGICCACGFNFDLHGIEPGV